MTRYDAVNYISTASPSARPVRTRAAARCRGRSSRRGAPGRRRAPRRRAMRWKPIASISTRRPRRQDRSADRPRGEVKRTIQVLCRRRRTTRSRRRSRRRQDRHRRRPGQAHRRRRRARGAEGRDDLLARHGRAAGRHALSRRFRGAAEAGRQGARGTPTRDPVHRRDPHRDRRRRHLRRRDGCLEPAEAGASSGKLRCIGSTTYKEYRQFFEKDRALVRRFQKIDVNEPSVPDAIEILKGLKPYFEDFHKVRYTDDAIKRRWNCPRATSTTASCRTRPST
jgi:hypothetical protein